MTKAAQEFTAVAPKMAAENIKMANAVGDGSRGVGDIKRGDATSIDAYIVSSISITYLISRRCGAGFKGLDYHKGSGTRCTSDF
jgi:hypothetical protein